MILIEESRGGHRQASESESGGNHSQHSYKDVQERSFRWISCHLLGCYRNSDIMTDDGNSGKTFATYCKALIDLVKLFSMTANFKEGISLRDVYVDYEIAQCYPL